MRQQITTDEHNRKEQMKTQAETQKKEQHETSRQFAQLARSVGGVEQAEFWQREKVKNLDRATRGKEQSAADSKTKLPPRRSSTC